MSLLWDALRVTERYLRTADAAKALDVHRTTLAKWVHKYGLEPAAVTMGGFYLWDLDDLRRQLREAQERRKRESEG
jgi:DNA-binding transcriptional MerR regulator